MWYLAGVRVNASGVCKYAHFIVCSFCIGCREGALQKRIFLNCENGEKNEKRSAQSVLVVVVVVVYYGIRACALFPFSCAGSVVLVLLLLLLLLLN